MDDAYNDDDDDDRRGGRGKGKSFVSQAEYDELSALCDRLMQEQDDLRGEIQRQARLLEVMMMMMMMMITAQSMSVVDTH